jgi:hypothetical protein
MGCGTGCCFYPGKKKSGLYTGRRVENVGRSLAKRMESHEMICESFSHVYPYAYIIVIDLLFCDVISTLYIYLYISGFQLSLT